MTDTNMEAYKNAPSFGDGLVAFLSSLGIGGFAWGAVWAVVELTRFGVGYFNLVWPDSYYLELVLLNLPWVFGVVAGFINYGKVLQLPNEA